MSTSLPIRSVNYNGPITDANRWSFFRRRPDDIFICAPAKSGMTWTQAICAMLIFGTADLRVQPAKLSPWLDANLLPVRTAMQMIEAQTHRRYFKTHTPLDGIPFYPECTYLAVYRDPRDTFLSMMRLSLKTAAGNSAARMEDDLHAAFRMWLTSPFVNGRGEQLSLAMVAHHFNGFWKHRELPNVHLIHYADLKRDLTGSIKKIAAALNLLVDDAMAARMANTASFSNMRQNAAQFAPGIGRGAWKSESDFFRQGDSEQWRDFLTPTELATYRNALAALVPGNAAHWLENGSGAN